jgi:hypothetical protein
MKRIFPLRRPWILLALMVLAVAAPAYAFLTRPEIDAVRAPPRLPPSWSTNEYLTLEEPADAPVEFTEILEMQQAPAVEDIWQPAPTPRGGVAWSLLESTEETTRTVDGVIYSRPVFPQAVRALAGRRIVMAGYMMPLEPGATQRHFVLMAYPPGCPFHFHALPNQFIEVYADTAVPLNEMDATVVSGVLELTGEDESGVFFRLRQARAS